MPTPEDLVPSPWQPIGTAPKARRGDGAIKIDILAKTWSRDSDTFKFMRCVNCYWDAASDNGRGDWVGVTDGYRAVAWMPIPIIPTAYP